MRLLTRSYFFFAVVALVLGIPSAHALEVKLCAPFAVPALDCLTLQSSSAANSSDGVSLSTTTFVLADPATAATTLTYGPFTISGTVTAQQSGTLQKITFNPTTITANANGGCNATDTNPCQLQIIATSDTVDFPFDKPVGGYPAGVFMAGGFTGTEPRHLSPPDPNGDAISMTGEAGGLDASVNPPVLLSNAVINATPGTGTGDAATSLPATCTGTPGCKFTATSAVKSFNSQIQETVQQVCGVEQASCKTRLKTTLNVNIKRAANRISLPGGVVTVTPPKRGDPPVNLLEILLAETLPQLASFDVQKLLVGRNDFALTAQLKLTLTEAINPATEEVYMRVGDFTLTFLPGKFKRLIDGKLYSFIGRQDGYDIAAVFARDRTDPTAWTFVAGVHNVQLRPLLPLVPNLAPVDVSVGGDTGSDLVAPTFF